MQAINGEALKLQQALNEGKWNEVIALSRPFLAAQPNSFIGLRAVAFANFNLQKWLESLEFANRAIAIRPDAVRLLFIRARALEKLKRPVKALAAWDEFFKFDPKNTKALYHYATLLGTVKRPKLALDAWNKLLEVEPLSVPGLTGRGNALRKFGKRKEALECFTKLLELKPDSPEAHNNMGLVLADEGDYDRAIDHYETALKLRKNYRPALNNIGNSLLCVGRYHEAIAYYDQALAINSELNSSKWNKGTAMTHLELSKEAWELFEFRPDHGKKILPRLENLSDGPKCLKGKKVLIQWEARFGDSIQLLRYLPKMLEYLDECYLQVPKELKSLFTRSFPGVKVITGDEPNGAEWRLPYVSLPLVMETFSVEAIPVQVPYLKVASELNPFPVKRKSAKSKRVGFIWRGNPVPAHRSVPFEALLPLLEVKGVQWFSLQKNLTDEEKMTLQGFSEVTIVDEQLSDFDVTAALVDSLDLVITIDSAVAHLSGALGKPIWVMLKYAADWRWGYDNQSSSPWYPTSVLYRQKRLGDWSDPIKALTKDLKRYIAK